MVQNHPSSRHYLCPHVVEMHREATRRPMNDEYRRFLGNLSVLGPKLTQKCNDSQLVLDKRLHALGTPYVYS